VRYEVLTEVMLRVQIFWHVTLCLGLLHYWTRRHYDPSKCQDPLAHQHSLTSHKT
jgi:hypothetical protein